MTDQADSFTRIERVADAPRDAIFFAIERPGGNGECWCGWYVPSVLTRSQPSFHDTRHEKWLEAAGAAEIAAWSLASRSATMEAGANVARKTESKRAQHGPRAGTLRDSVLSALRDAGPEGSLIPALWERAQALGATTKSQQPHIQVADALFRLAAAEPPLAKRIGKGLWAPT